MTTAADMTVSVGGKIALMIDRLAGVPLRIGVLQWDKVRPVA